MLSKGRIAVVMMLPLLLAAAPSSAFAPALVRVSVAADGSDAYGDSSSPSISVDGRFVAFDSSAANLVPGDSNNVSDIFVRDQAEAITERISVSSDGAEANARSCCARISGDGRYVAFLSFASNLDSVARPPGWMAPTAFVHDRLTGETRLVSIRTDGVPAPVYRIDLSANGRFVAIISNSLTLDDSTGGDDVYLQDLETGITLLVSRAPDGTQLQAPSSVSLAGDGRFLLFSAPNLYGTPPPPSNSIPGLYLYGLESGTTSYLILADGEQALSYGVYSDISDDGRYVALLGRAVEPPSDQMDPWNDVFVYDRQNMTTVKASLATDGGDPYGAARSLAISEDGRWVTYSSDATDLVNGDGNACEDIFRWDSLNAATARVSMAFDGGGANHLSRYPAISADGRYVAFESWARNLVADDHNGDLDVFLADTWQTIPGAVLPSAAGTEEPRCGPYPGDADCSGTVTAVDALLVLRKLVELRPWGECVRLVGSVNCDGKLDAVDALWILRAVAGLIQLPQSCGK